MWPFQAGETGSRHECCSNAEGRYVKSTRYVRTHKYVDVIAVDIESEVRATVRCSHAPSFHHNFAMYGNSMQQITVGGI